MNSNNSRPIKDQSLRLAKGLSLCLLTFALLANRSNARNQPSASERIGLSETAQAATDNSQSTTAANVSTFTPISLCPTCSTLPIGITANGLISGFYFDADGNLHAFIDRNGNYLTVDVPGALFTEAGRSNEPGQTAGDYLATDGIDRPFVRNRDGSFSLRDGAPGASVTFGNDINNRGDVLGWFTTDPNGQTGFHGYVLRGNDYILTFAYPGADVTNTYAIGFNQAGTIVGSYTTTTPGVEHGFVRSADGRFIQLDFPGSVQTEAFDINDAGDIVGRYQDTAGTEHGFLLRHGHFTTINAPSGPDTFAFGINPRGDVVGFSVTASGQDIGFLAR